MIKHDWTKVLPVGTVIKVDGRVGVIVGYGDNGKYKILFKDDGSASGPSNSNVSGRDPFGGISDNADSMGIPGRTNPGVSNKIADPAKQKKAAKSAGGPGEEHQETERPERHQQGANPTKNPAHPLSDEPVADADVVHTSSGAENKGIESLPVTDAPLAKHNRAVTEDGVSLHGKSILDKGDQRKIEDLVDEHKAQLGIILPKSEYGEGWRRGEHAWMSTMQVILNKMVAETYVNPNEPSRKHEGLMGAVQQREGKGRMIWLVDASSSMVPNTYSSFLTFMTNFIRVHGQKMNNISLDIVYWGSAFNVVSLKGRPQTWIESYKKSFMNHGGTEFKNALIGLDKIHGDRAALIVNLTDGEIYDYPADLNHYVGLLRRVNQKMVTLQVGSKEQKLYDHLSALIGKPRYYFIVK